MPTTAHFTPRAQQVLHLAELEAREFGHGYLGTEHLLLGLIREGSGPAARMFGDAGISLSGTRAAVDAVIGPVNEVARAHSGWTPGIYSVLDSAIAASRRRGHHYNGTEHLLLVLLSDKAGVASSVLDHLDVDRNRLRQQAIESFDRERGADAGNPAIPLDDRGLVGDAESREERWLRGLVRHPGLWTDVLKWAGSEAERFNHGHLGTEHVLLALLRGSDDLSAQLLHDQGLTHEAVMHAVEQVVGRDKGRLIGGRQRTDRLRDVLLSAIDEGEQLNRRRLRPAHLLRALAKDEGGAWAHVLVEMGTDLEALRGHVIELTDRPEHSEVHDPVIPAEDEGISDAEDEAIRVSRKELRWHEGVGFSAMRVARHAAKNLKHEHIGTEHLLLGIIGEDNGIAARILSELGVTLTGARAVVEAIDGPGTEDLFARPRYSKRMQLVLMQAASARRSQSDTRIEHVLLALAADDACTGSRVLDRMGGDRAELRRRLLQAMDETDHRKD